MASWFIGEWEGVSISLHVEAFEPETIMSILLRRGSFLKTLGLR